MINQKLNQKHWQKKIEKVKNKNSREPKNDLCEELLVVFSLLQTNIISCAIRSPSFL